MEPPEEHISELRPNVRSGEVAEISAEVLPGPLSPGMVELCESDRKESKNEGGREVGGNRSEVVDNSWHERPDDFECEPEDIREDDEDRHGRDDEKVLSGEFLVIENGIESRSHESYEFLKEEPEASELTEPNRSVHEKDDCEKHRHEQPHRKKRGCDETKNRLSFEGRNMRSGMDFGSCGYFGRCHESKKRLKSR